MALVWTAALMSVVVSASVVEVFVLRHISLLVIGSGMALGIPVCNDCVLANFFKVWMDSTCPWYISDDDVLHRTKSIHNTLVLPLK